MVELLAPRLMDKGNAITAETKAAAFHSFICCYQTTRLNRFETAHTGTRGRIRRTFLAENK